MLIFDRIHMKIWRIIHRHCCFFRNLTVVTNFPLFRSQNQQLPAYLYNLRRVSWTN